MPRNTESSHPSIAPPSTSTGGHPSLRDAAISGGLWTACQLVVNKIVSLGSTFVLMYLLVPDEFGLVALATSIQGLVWLLPAFTMGDVLLSRPGEFERLVGTAFWIAAGATGLTCIGVLVAGHWGAAHYENQAIFGACALMALRPLADLALLVPLSRLREGLEFKKISSIDAITQISATLLAIGMAVGGAGWISLALPQIAFTLVRAYAYWQIGKCDRPVAPHWLPSEARGLLRGFILSGLGQYVHGGLIVATPLIISQFGEERDIGWYAMAFALSASVNTIVAVSIGLVLQPIFARMSGDRDRQSSAFLRACGLVACCAMPVCLLQAVLCASAFRSMLPERWAGAISMTQLLCVGQGFYFAVNPAMGFLKAQGRFGTFLAWQGAQLVLVTAAMFAAGYWCAEQKPLAVITVAALYHVISSPVGVWLCVRGADRSVAMTLDLFLRPLLVATLSIALPYVALCKLLPTGYLGDWLLLTITPVIALFAYPWLLRTLAPRAAHDCAELMRAVAGRIGFRPAMKS
jgi:teichuronic acid exporter